MLTVRGLLEAFIVCALLVLAVVVLIGVRHEFSPRIWAAMSVTMWCVIAGVVVLAIWMVGDDWFGSPFL